MCLHPRGGRYQRMRNGRPLKWSGVHAPPAALPRSLAPPPARGGLPATGSRLRLFRSWRFWFWRHVAGVPPRADRFQCRWTTPRSRWGNRFMRPIARPATGRSENGRHCRALRLMPRTDIRGITTTGSCLAGFWTGHLCGPSCRRSGAFFPTRRSSRSSRT